MHLTTTTTEFWELVRMFTENNMWKLFSQSDQVWRVINGLAVPVKKKAISWNYSIYIWLLKTKVQKNQIFQEMWNLRCHLEIDDHVSFYYIYLILFVNPYLITSVVKFEQLNHSLIVVPLNFCHRYEKPKFVHSQARWHSVACTTRFLVAYINLL